ncbi:MAG: branched-chain amino acid ABC transporter permease [Betaproteobacteria bacterium]|nr:branched-chain amino acid ABC transporter permease [Betaproteobacteria bacterium]
MKSLSFSRSWPWWLALAAAGLPWLAGGNQYVLSVLSLGFTYALAALGLNLITGYTGQLNLAHAGFMAIGAYTVGILTVNHGVGFWWAFALSGCVAAALGLPIGWLSLRLRGHYFAIFTLCVGVVINLVIEKWDGLTGGVVGILGIPVPPGPPGLDFGSARGQYLLCLACLVLGTWVMQRLMRSLLGRSFIAVRNSEPLAEALGIPLMRTKLLAFVISVFYAGMAGGLYAGTIRFLGPDLADIGHSFDIVTAMLVGGLGTVAGPIVGSLVLPWISQYLQFMQDYRMLVFGPLLVLLLIFLPGGLVGSVRPWLARRAQPAAAAVVTPGVDDARA